MTITRVSSQDLGYTNGSLSVYPEAKDDKLQLYYTKNNAETVLRQSLTYAGKYVIVEDSSIFPDNGIIRIGPPAGQSGTAELIYYDNKTAGVFRNLIRGFAGSRQNPWPVGSHVTCGVFAETHNATKDAIINIETNLGTIELPDPDSLNGILKAQESRFLAPRPLFRAFPDKGPSPLKVRFQNFSVGPLIRYLWDFGDGTTSAEKSPIHTYQKEGVYTVKLNVITSLGAQGVITKSNYITVNDEEKQPFFYVTPTQGYSKETAEGLAIEPTEFTFVDQTDGNIVQRYWVFDGDGENEGTEVENQSVAVLDPNIHTVKFIYDKPSEYKPSLLILYESQRLQRVFLKEEISVL